MTHPDNDQAGERPVAVVDIDGVVADVRHRLHHLSARPKRWDAFFRAADDDAAHPEGLEVVATLAADHEIVYVTGRPEHLRRATEAWLMRHGIGGHRLVMRRTNDRRPAAVMKLQAVRHLAGERTVAVIVDDDQAVLDAYAKAGFTTFPATWEARLLDEARALADAQERQGRT